MMKYNQWNNLLGWMCGLISTIVYILCTDKTTSWWDTGEFIASAYKLEIVHQPGAPLFLLIQNLFSNLAFGDTSKIAYMMNVGSAICSGLTIVFLFWTITALARKILSKTNPHDDLNIFKILGAGMVGALAYSFSDTFWYSAVESEVYAMSSLCTAVVFWLAMKWERRADEADSNRWIIVIAFVMGLSIGVHLLNLLSIPALTLLVYFRKSNRISWQGILKSFIGGLTLLAFILWGVIQYSVKLAAQFDLFFVNGLSLPFGTGIMTFIVLLVSLMLYGLWIAKKKNKPTLQLLLLCFAFIYFGFGSYALLVVRAQTNISLNNNIPDNVFSFLGYLSREQYQSEPLLKGPKFTSQIVGINSKTDYRKEKDGYAPIHSTSGYQYDKEVLFPRVYSEKHSEFYKQYLGLKDGEEPSFMHNMRFFFEYQINHMYTRYFLWNFVGRQNDQPAQQGYTAGNWISGISFLDEMRLPGQGNISDFFKSNPSRNTYFFMPLILGVIGFLWQWKKSKRDTAIVGLLFFFTGIAIVLYLNQTPLQPRERDYAYAGSFYVFAIWIGLGMIGLTEFLQKYSFSFSKPIAYGSLALSLLMGPMLLVKENWDDHDRSARSMSKDVAYNTLMSCDPNAILFTYMDNDTFPLWYLQEVEGVRTDVRVINYGYLQSDWYVKQMMRDMNQSKALPIGFSYEQVKKGIRDGIRVMDMGIEGYSDIDKLLAVMLSDKPEDQVKMPDGTSENILANQKWQLKVNRESVLSNLTIPEKWQSAIPEYLQWEFKQNYVSRAELSLMGILVNNNWERPIYFTSMSPNSIFMGMDKYLASEGLVYQLLPVEVGQPDIESTLVNTDKLYDHVKHTYAWGDISTISHLDTDSNFYYENWVFPKVYQQGLAALMQAGETEKAKDLALKAYDFQPEVIQTVRQAYMNSIVVDTLYKVAEVEKAKLLGNKNINALDEYLNQQLAITKKANVGFDPYVIQLGLATLDRYLEVAQQAKDEQMLASLVQMQKKYQEAWM
ncbi:DUF2723 domain-containing protein [Sphingobacterium sp. HJSM2_6]|uniref:glycosyltransferase family 117 protein n=1 Tax=Sphingobacterium sp. HJSM2_6 TaxID=3366264 RepID=UPI003BE6870D